MSSTKPGSFPRALATLASGALFGFGLSYAGMSQFFH